jgi:hypothetical protein
MNYQNHDYATDDHSQLPADPAPARSHANVDAGTYAAKFSRWHWDTSKKGDMCLAAMLRIVGGPFDGQQVRGTLYFDTDKADKNGRTAADRSMEALRSAGLAGEIDAIDENTGGIDAGEVSISVEINDASQTLASLVGTPGETHETKHDGHYWVRRDDARIMRSRSTIAYATPDENRWPAGSLHAIRSTERELGELEGRIKDTTAYLNELVEELNRREVTL